MDVKLRSTEKSENEFESVKFIPGHMFRLACEMFDSEKIFPEISFDYRHHTPQARFKGAHIMSMTMPGNICFLVLFSV